MKIITNHIIILLIIAFISPSTFAGIIIKAHSSRLTPDFQTQPDTIKVMTFNIRNGMANDGDNSWDNRKEMVYKVIAEQAADIVGLQEAYIFQTSQIEHSVRGYDIITTGRDDGEMAGEHCSIFYRRDRFTLADHGTFWLSDTPQTPGSTTWGNSIPRICTWVKLIDKTTEQGLYLYNVHYDHQSQEARYKSSILVDYRISKRDPDCPAILLGDFNMTLTNESAKYLLQDSYTPPVKLTETWNTLYPDLTNMLTCHLFNGGTEGSKIDHIFLTEDLQVLSTQIIYYNQDNRYPSDHYPVTATITLP